MGYYSSGKHMLKILKNNKSQKTKSINNNWLKEKNIQTIFDVGANEGQFAEKIRTLFPNATIYAFEPLPHVYERLVEMFKGDQKFIPCNYALGEKEEETIIFLNEYSPSSSLLEMADEHKKHFDFARKETVHTIYVKRLDDIAPSIKIAKPALLKIDVQGFEEKVILGGRNTIPEFDMILIEVSFRELYKEQPLFDDIYNQLKKVGFNYCGNFEQLISPKDGSILQADAIFIRKSE